MDEEQEKFSTENPTGKALVNILANQTELATTVFMALSPQYSYVVMGIWAPIFTPSADGLDSPPL